MPPEHNAEYFYKMEYVLEVVDDARTKLKRLYPTIQNDKIKKSEQY